MHGPDATEKGWKELVFGMRVGCRFRPLIAGFHRKIGQCQCLPRASETACGPWVQRTYSDGNTYSGGFSAGPHRYNHPAVLGRILGSGGLAAIFTRLEHAGLRYFICSVGESPGDSYFLIWPYCVHPLLLNGTGLHQNTSAIPAAHSFAVWRQSLRKVVPSLNRRSANSPIHTNPYFPGQPEASIQNENLYIEEKNQFSPRLLPHPVRVYR